MVGNVITDVPTASDHLATKAYVDASSGGGSLKVYKTDGTTLIGTFGGFYGSNTPTACSGWGFWTSAGALHVVTPADCTTPTPYATIYYSLANCTGAMTSDIALTHVTDGTIYAYQNPSAPAGPGWCYSYRPYGNCYNVSPFYMNNTSLYYFNWSTESAPTPGICGFGNCVVK